MMHLDTSFLVDLLRERRQRQQTERRRESLNQLLLKAPKAWHGVKLWQPDWSAGSHSVAFTAETQTDKLFVHIILNAYWEPLEFELPPLADASHDRWHRWIDTSLDSPQDIVEWQTAPPVPGRIYRAGPRSVVLLFARHENASPFHW